MLVDLFIKMFSHQDSSVLQEIENYINRDQKNACYELIEICDITRWEEVHDGVIELMNVAYEILEDLMQQTGITIDDLFRNVKDVDGIH